MCYVYTLATKTWLLAGAEEKRAKKVDKVHNSPKGAAGTQVSTSSSFPSGNQIHKFPKQMKINSWPTERNGVENAR